MNTTLSKAFPRKPQSHEDAMLEHCKVLINHTASQFVGERNDQVTRASIEAALSIKLRELYEYGDISDYQCICDETNNTAFVIEDNKLNVNINLKLRNDICLRHISVTLGS